MEYKINGTLFNKLIEAAKENAADQRQARMAKRLFLLDNAEEIKKAKEAGYSYAMIAKATTDTLLEMDIPKTFVVKTKEGKEVTKETKIVPADIKKICEPAEEVQLNTN